MLRIRGWQNEERETEDSVLEWHLGEPVPNFARIVSFAADGDELELFAQAMRATEDVVHGVAYTKQRGLHVFPYRDRPVGL